MREPTLSTLPIIKPIGNMLVWSDILHFLSRDILAIFRFVGLLSEGFKLHGFIISQFKETGNYILPMSKKSSNHSEAFPPAAMCIKNINGSIGDMTININVISITLATWLY